MSSILKISRTEWDIGKKYFTPPEAETFTAFNNFLHNDQMAERLLYSKGEVFCTVLETDNSKALLFHDADFTAKFNRRYVL